MFCLYKLPCFEFPSPLRSVSEFGGTSSLSATDQSPISSITLFEKKKQDFSHQSFRNSDSLLPVNNSKEIGATDGQMTP